MSTFRRTRSQKLADGNDSQHSSKSSLAGAAPAADAIPPDISYKLSKKVAQLTKVIYYLNTKNEDHTVEIQSLAEAYEDEIQDVILDGRKRIDAALLELGDSQLRVEEKEARLELCARKLSDQEAALAAAREHATVLEQAIAESDREKQDFSHDQEEQKRLIEDLKAEKANLEGELVVVRSQLDRQLKEQADEFGERLDDINREAIHASQQLVASHDQDKEALEEEKRALQAKLHEALALAKEEQEKQLNACLVEIELLKDRVHDGKMDHQNKMQEAEQEHASKLDAEHKLLLQSESALAESKATLDRKCAQFTDLQKDLDKQREQLVASQKSFEESKARNASLKEQHLELQRKIQNLEEHISNLDTQLKLKTDDVQRGVEALRRAGLNHDTLQKTLENTSEELNVAQSKIRTLEKAKTMVESDLSTKEFQSRGLEKLLEDEIARHEKLLEISLADLKGELKDKHLEEIKSFSTEWQTKMAKAVSEKDEEIANLKAEHVKAFEEAALVFSTLQAADETLKEEYKICQSEKENLQVHLTNSTIKLNDITFEERRKADTIKELKELTKGLEMDKADLFQRMVHLDEEIRQELQTKFDKEKAEAAEISHMASVRDCQRLKTSMTDEHETNIRNMMAARERQAEEQIQAIRINQQKEIAKMQKLITAAEAALATIKEEKDALVVERDLAARAHLSELETAREAQRKGMDEAKKQWEAESQGRETQLKVASTIALSQLQKRSEVDRTELETSHRNQLDDLRTFHTKSQMAFKKEAEQQNQAALKRLKIECGLQYTDLDKQLRIEMADKLSKMDAGHRAEMSFLVTTHSEALAAKVTVIEELNEEVSVLKSQQEEALRTIAEHESTISDLEQEVAERTAEVTATKEELIMRLESLKMQLDSEHQTANNEKDARHVEEVQQMLREFDQAQAYLKRQITMQAKKYLRLQEADQKYINREPRDADVKQIHELESHLEQGKQIMSALMDELEHYKLELNNREANFNKIFNKTPIVGLTQPVPISKVMIDNIQRQHARAPIDV
ncbi:hypothetical protein HKX48_003204 [Thoreauomyces humboldtii]|nr:hypothetical protein HKX48_003204 [Thoreauomyces humboldtii]